MGNEKVTSTLVVLALKVSMMAMSDR
jgi:hypothetical protein